MAKSTECRRCGKSFNNSDGRVKYCSDCPNVRWVMKECRGCGRIKPPGKGAQYCPDCRDEHKSKTASSINNRKRAKRYGLSVENLNALLAIDQCEVCGSNVRLVVDHDHATGVVRGLLCDLCNKALGQARDDVSILAGLIQYLENRSRS